MTPFHKYFGLALAIAFALLALWGLVAWIRNRHPGGAFWALVAICQVSLAVQAIAGIVVFALGGRRPWLHYAYGGFPILVIIAAHRFSKRIEGLEWAAFAFAGAVNFGLLLRGFMTGAGS